MAILINRWFPCCQGCCVRSCAAWILCPTGSPSLSSGQSHKRERSVQIKHMTGTAQGKWHIEKSSLPKRWLFFFCLSVTNSPMCSLDPERVVRPIGHPLLCEAELRPRSEHDRSTREVVLSPWAPTCGPSAPHWWDPPSCAQPALHCQEPSSSALLRRSPQARPGWSDGGLLNRSQMFSSFTFFTHLMKVERIVVYSPSVCP